MKLHTFDTIQCITVQSDLADKNVHNIFPDEDIFFIQQNCQISAFAILSNGHWQLSLNAWATLSVCIRPGQHTHQQKARGTRNGPAPQKRREK